MMEAHNTTNSTYKLGLTPFSDLTREEFEQLYTSSHFTASGNFIGSVSGDGDGDGDGELYDEFLQELDLGSEDVPESVDWSKSEGMAPIKNQGRSNTCWAFSAVCTVEFLHYLSTGRPITFSEQQVCDCDRRYNSGCRRGRVYGAFKYIIENGGINTDLDYPYTGVDGPCKSTAHKPGWIDDIRFLPVVDENILKRLVAKHPVVAHMRIRGTNFGNYTGGIIVYDSDSGFNLDHAVVLVGFGTDKVEVDGVMMELDYWIIRNAYGPLWGEKGNRLECDLPNKVWCECPKHPRNYVAIVKRDGRDLRSI